MAAREGFRGFSSFPHEGVFAAFIFTSVDEAALRVQIDRVGLTQFVTTIEPTADGFKVVFQKEVERDTINPKLERMVQQ